jgi:pimeloyl-ACP methyl ester carboxylesterase
MKAQVTKLHAVRGGSNQLIASAALLAAGFIRNLSIKRHVPKSRCREIRLLAERPESHASRSLIFREKGAGNVPTIVLGGFVPDATETVEFQRRLLRQHGSIYYVNFPRNGFCCDMFSAQLSDLVADLRARGQRPIIFSVSFGCGLLIDFLRQADVAIHESIRGLVLVSPVLCTADLIRPPHEKQGGVRFLESNLKRIVSAGPADGEDMDKHIERSRRCFQSLFTGGSENRSLGIRHRAIRKKIFDVIHHTTARGGFQRVMALREFGFPPLSSSVFGGPVLTLLAENESDILVPSSPTLELFREYSRYTRLFPECRVQTVRSGDCADGVAHASLIFHHSAYNGHIDSWYTRLLYPRLQLAV